VLHLRLLRCSTNLSGPTDNFRATDRHIVDALNQEAALVFSEVAPLNHVLAQIYQNTLADAEKKQAKARISSHADKTKDMPGDGAMVFCTFYEHIDRLGPVAGDPFDRGRSLAIFHVEPCLILCFERKRHHHRALDRLPGAPLLPRAGPGGGLFGLGWAELAHAFPAVRARGAC